MDNCCKFLSRVIKPAEQAGVRLCPELLNSKVNHPDYFLDHSALGFELCRRLKSPFGTGDLLGTLVLNRRQTGLGFRQIGLTERHLCLQFALLQ